MPKTNGIQIGTIRLLVAPALDHAGFVPGKREPADRSGVFTRWRSKVGEDISRQLFTDECRLHTQHTRQHVPTIRGKLTATVDASSRASSKALRASVV